MDRRYILKSQTFCDIDGKEYTVPYTGGPENIRFLKDGRLQEKPSFLSQIANFISKKKPTDPLEFICVATFVGTYLTILYKIIRLR